MFKTVSKLMKCKLQLQLNSSLTQTYDNKVEQGWETNRRINWALTLIPLIIGLKTLRGALAANLDRVMIRT
jgi:hypothetical protein